MDLALTEHLAAHVGAFQAGRPIVDQQVADPILPGQIGRTFPIEISAEDLLDHRVRGDFFSDVALFRHDIAGEFRDWFPFARHASIVASGAHNAIGAVGKGEGEWL